MDISTKKRIVFTITNMSHGKGGHFYSLFSTIEALSHNIEAFVLNIGLKPSPVLDKIVSGEYAFLPFRGNILKMQKDVFDFLRKIKPDAVHSFDTQSLFFVRMPCFILKYPLLHTKCGGANPKRYFPAISPLILYSEENMEYFKKKYPSSKLFFMPQRVLKHEFDILRIGELKNRCNIGNKFVFLRVARICESYKKSIIGAIRLINRLQNDGFLCAFLLVGVIQEERAYQEINDAMKCLRNSYVITEDRYTSQASQLIGIADAVIATGRGAMEAAMHGKIVLAPVQQQNIPVLVNKGNIKHFFDANFSERTHLVDVNINDIYSDITMIMNEKRERESLECFLQQFADREFNASKIVEPLLDLYSKIAAPGFNVLDFCLHFYVTRNFFLKYSNGLTKTCLDKNLTGVN